jgi:histidinol-phosphate aminotransferase
VPVRLNTNECPYPLPDGFVQDLQEAVRAIPLNRYPDREATQLREVLAAHTGHAFEGTWAANGSNEVIQQLLLAYGGPGRAAVVFPPTYELFARLSWATHTGAVSVEVAEPWAIGPTQIAAAVVEQPDVVFVCSPNNPTGNTQAPGVVAELASALETALIVVDEAYIEFGGHSALGLVATHPNVVVVRTMSKAFALAGARLGYLLADPVVVEDLRRVRLPYHVSALTQAAGLTALQHSEDALAILDALREQRDRILVALSQTAGVTAYPSQSNFVLFRTERDASDVWRGLLDRGVLVRDFTKTIPGCLRVNAGTPEETEAFLNAMKEVL